MAVRRRHTQRSRQSRRRPARYLNSSDSDESSTTTDTDDSTDTDTAQTVEAEDTGAGDGGGGDSSSSSSDDDTDSSDEDSNAGGGGGGGGDPGGGDPGGGDPGGDPGDPIGPVQGPAQIPRAKRHVMRVLGVCGIAVHNRLLVADHAAFESLKDMALMDLQDYRDLAKSLNAGQAVARIGSSNTKRLMAATHWVKSRIKCGQSLDYQLFDDAACRAAVAEVQGDKDLEDVSVPMPDKLKPEKWTDWQESLENYLDSKKSANGVPLSYVVREEPCPDTKRLRDDRSWQALYNAPLKGANFKKDAKTVFCIIKQLTISTSAFNLIRSEERKKDGRKLLQILRDHFDGPSNELSRRTTAHNVLENIRYVDEGGMKFLDFVSKMQGAYNVLERYGFFVPVEFRTWTLLQRMKGCTNAAVRVCAQNAYQTSKFRNNWQKMVSLIGENVQLNDSRSGNTNRQRKVASTSNN
jgi:hypothetical protein